MGISLRGANQRTADSQGWAIALRVARCCVGVTDYRFNQQAHKLDAATWGAATKGKVALWDVIIHMEYNISQDITLYEKQNDLCKYNTSRNIYIHNT